MLFNYKLESDNTFETINIILTTLKRKIGSHLSLNGCKVTMLSASAWKKHINLSHVNKGNYIQVIRYTITKNTDTHIIFIFILTQHSLSVL